MLQRILIVGLGLIGGSLAKSIRQKLPTCKVYALDSQRSSVLQAKEEGVIDGFFETAQDVSDAFDVAFLCTPPSTIVELVRRLAPCVGERCILCDMAGVKGSIVQKLEELPEAFSFVGGHPMAGSERTGYEGTRASLLDNAYFVLTRCKKTKEGQLEAVSLFAEALHLLPVEMTPEEHDRAVGIVSHLPHVAAAGLCHMLKVGDELTNKRLVAGGFRDLTRIAASTPQLWGQICTENREAVAWALDHYITVLQDVRAHLGDSPYLQEYFQMAQSERKTLDSRFAGLIPKIYQVTVDIQDRPGSIAQAAEALGSAGVNIKNIHIANSREDFGGVMVVALPDQAALEKARETLLKAGFLLTGEEI